MRPPWDTTPRTPFFLVAGRDPRWGRNLETYSESPELVGAYASAMVDGAQWGDRSSTYLQAIIAVKHAAAYQVEDNRMARNANISVYDLGETYLPAWKEVVTGASYSTGALGYMCRCACRTLNRRA